MCEALEQMTPPNLNSINDYLTHGKTNLHRAMEFATVIIVIGNETCDLDSAVSSLVYGFFQNNVQKDKENVLVLTVYNIPQSELHLKTEVVFWLNRFEVNLELIVFRDQLDFDFLHEAGKLQLILVDHHVLSPRQKHLEASVIKVIDHRPVEKDMVWSNAEVIIEPVGSCATLIARELQNNCGHTFTHQTSMLLYGAIVLDTAGLSETSGRTKPLDMSIANSIEKMNKCNREDILNILCKARSDVQNLTATDLLVKDMKSVCSIPICGFPVLVKSFLKKPSADVAVHSFCVERNISVLVLMGQEIVCGGFIRDLAIYSFGSGLEKAKKLIEYLQASQDPYLELAEVSDIHKTEGLILFTQNNTKASRKQILPIVQAALRDIPELADLAAPLEL